MTVLCSHESKKCNDEYNIAQLSICSHSSFKFLTTAVSMFTRKMEKGTSSNEGRSAWPSLEVRRVMPLHLH